MRDRTSRILQTCELTFRRVHTVAHAILEINVNIVHGYSMMLSFFYFLYLKSYKGAYNNIHELKPRAIDIQDRKRITRGIVRSLKPKCNAFGFSANAALSILVYL